MKHVAASFKWFWTVGLAERERCGITEIEAVCGSLKKIQSVRNRGRTQRGERERERKSVFVELLMDLIHYVVSYTALHAAAG